MALKRKEGRADLDGRKRESRKEHRPMKVLILVQKYSD
jgi:hypothetical protein